MARTSKESPVNSSENIPKKLRVFGNKPFIAFRKELRSIGGGVVGHVQQGSRGDLGGGVYKFRLAREGEGQEWGEARSIVAMKKNDRAVMVFGFEKKDMANIGGKELKAFKKLAKEYCERLYRGTRSARQTGRVGRD